MTTESIFTFIAILLSVYTLIPIEDKKLIGLKFTKVETIIIIIISFYILYLVLLFDHFMVWFNSWQIFINRNGFTSNEYAFILSFLLLIYLGYKVLKSKFPFSNRNKLIEYYKYLSGKEKFNQLYDLITKYELETLFQVKIIKNTKPSKKELGTYELLYIIFDEKVVENFTRIDPYFYSKFIHILAGEHRFTDSIQHYYKVLISNPFSPLIRELRDNSKENLPLENKPLLYEIIGDPKISSEYKIYQPIGNYCKELIRTERDNMAYSDYNRSFYNNKILWSLPIIYCIHFFNLMISEAIYKKHTDSLWLNYYERFIQMICDNIDTEKLNTEEKENEYPTYNHKIIHDVFDNIVNWLTLIDENYFDNCISGSIFTSLFSSANYLSISSNQDISFQFKTDCFERVIQIYFEINDELQKQYSDILISKSPFYTEEFFNLFTAAWENTVDELWAENPYPHDIPKVTRFTKDVIDKHNLNTRFSGNWFETK